MTSPTPVGTATVLIRASIGKVKEDITNAVQDGWDAAQRDALAAGRNAGKRWGRGFKAGLAEERIADAMERQFRAAERAAGLSGARAGRRYANAFNAAARSAAPPDPSPQGTNSNSATSPRPPRRASTSGGGGGSPNRRPGGTPPPPGTGGNDDSRGGNDQPRGPDGRWIPRGGGGNDPRRNTKSTHTIRTVLNDSASKVLKAALTGIMVALKGIILLSAAAMAALAMQAAIAPLISIVGVLGQMGGALLMLPALANAVALPLAGLAIGFNGITGAFQAMAQNSQSAEQTAKAVAQAQKQVESAQRGVESATRGVASAERGIEQAVRTSRNAREALNDTIKQTIERIQDLNLELKGAELDEESALIGVERARERLANMPTGSTALDYREANLAIRQAQQRLDEVRESNADLRDETAQANAEGIEGSRNVRNAREGVADAIQGEKDAQQGLLDAQQGLADAQERLAEAITAVQEAAQGSGADKFAEAMAKLSDNAKDFVLQMQALGPEWTETRKFIQDKLFAGLGSDVSNLARLYMPALKDGLGGVNDALNRTARSVISAFAAPDAIEKFRLVMDRVRSMINWMQPGFFALVGVFKNLSTVGSEFLVRFGAGFTSGARRLEVWSQNFDHIRALIERGIQVGKLFFAIIGNLGGALGGIFKAGEESGYGFLQSLELITGQFERFVKSSQGQEALTEFFRKGGDAIVAIGPALESLVLGFLELGQMLAGLGTMIAPGVTDFINGLREGIQNLQPAVDVIGPKLSELFSALGDLMPSVGDAVSSLVIAFSPYIDLMTVLSRTLLPVVVDLLERFAPQIAAMAPLIVAMAVAWKGYNIAVGIKNALDKTALGQWVLAKIALVGHAIATGAATAATWLLNAALAVLTSPITLIIVAVAALVAGLVWFFTQTEIGKKIIEVVWNAIQAAIAWAWQKIQTIWDAMLAAFRAVGDFFSWVWENLIKPAWSALSTAIQWYWENVIKVAWDALLAALRGIGDFFSWVWNSVIKPAWDALGNGINWVWENVIKKAFDALRGGLDLIKSGFESAVDFIGKMWDGLKGLVAKPVKFVVETVYNNGIRAAWNKVAGWLNLPELPEAQLGELAGYKDGGYTGPGGKDEVAGVVHGDEFVVRKESRRKFETRNPGALDYLNRTGMLPGYQDGGVVAAMTEIVKRKYPMLSMTSGLRPGDSGMHGSGLAADFSNGSGNTPAQLGLAQDIAKTYPGSAELIYDSPGWSGNIKNGKNVGAFGEFYTMAQAGNHKHHVHWGMTVPPTMDFDGGVFEGGSDGGGGGGVFSAVTNWLRDKVADAFDAIMDPIGRNIPVFGSGMGEVPKAMFDKMRSGVRDFITGKADEKDNAGGTATGSSDWQPGAGAEQWRQMMIDAYRNQGYEPTPEKIDAWVRQIHTESTGNPNAVQGIVDVNGTGEAAGVGLGQMIPTTWQAYRDPSLPDNRKDPWAMTNAMVRYGEQKYGSNLLNVIGQGHGYDQGGWLQPGKTLVNNQTGKPEPVFNPQQWDVLKQGLNYGGADQYLKDNLPGLQSSMQNLAVEAFKETIIGGLFGEDTLGIDGLINKYIIDPAVAQALGEGGGNAAQPAVSEGEAQAKAGIVAENVYFNGMDPQKVGDEVSRAVGAGMTPVNGRYRAP